MPSAASNVKIDKQISSNDNALAESANAALTPIRQAITTIEHKIRNLEKRKSKLESYRDLQNSGKELKADQKTALAKINEVVMTLDFARDLYKQFLGIASSSEKDAKKQAKRDQAVKNQQELARLREILLVQDALNQMGSDGVRDDFLHGRNGAAQLTENDLKLLDDLYPAVTPKHEAGNPTSFTNEVQAAAEHLLAVVDGKQKDVFGGSYSQIKEILGKIHESGYFDQSQEVLIVEETIEPVVEPVPAAPLDQSDPIPEISNEEPLAGSSKSPLLPLPEQQLEIPGPIQTITIEATNHPALHGAPRVPPVEQMAPHPIAQEMFYQPPPPQPRPITEMLGTGSFFFLQESEIDTPEQIPTQTFTNQSFVVQMAPHFPQQMSPNLPPVVVAPMPIPVDDGTLVKAQKHLEDIDKHSLGRVPPPHLQQRNVNANVAPPHHDNHQAQSFYNNGYSNSRPSNRPPARNGVHHQARPQATRH